ncbi:cytochrome P450 family protein [Nocardiopsis suaedae]|uniref:Cytochrome P450 n=1 Tax=Nocardiopsis suaedae TaxID=3018444 RepID=A0ABT4TSQ3_9ACTN|nr:cytochrome P450 [Nocardiopsis suaedae]MDA2807289.1 cytochrome P450 [Nocardiopsis suaedae]
MTERPDTAPGCPLHEAAVPLYKYAEHGEAARVWETLRERYGQVAPVELEPGLPVWLLLGYEENLEVMRDWGGFSRDTRRWCDVRDGRRSPGDDLPIGMGYSGSALYADGAEHARLIAPVTDALARLSDARVRADITRAADRLIDDFCAEGGADLVADYCALLPSMVLNRLFGLDDAFGYALGDLTTAMWGHDGDRSAEAAARMRDYFAGLVRHKRAVPGEDLTSWMLGHASGPTDQETADQLVTMAAAAHLPTANLLGNVLRELLSDDGLARDFAGGGLLLDEVVDHVVWTVPPVQVLPARYATRPAVVGGTRVAEGEPLAFGLAAAHADPRLRRGDQDETAVPSGHNRAHLIWGAGEHRCPARAVAERVVEIGVERLRARLGGLRLALPPEELWWAPSLFYRGPAALPVEFEPAEPLPAPEPAPAPAVRSPDPGPEEGSDALLVRVLRWWQGSGRRGRRRG